MTCMRKRQYVLSFIDMIFIQSNAVLNALKSVGANCSDDYFAKNHAAFGLNAHLITTHLLTIIIDLFTFNGYMCENVCVYVCSFVSRLTLGEQLQHSSDDAIATLLLDFIFFF